MTLHKRADSNGKAFFVYPKTIKTEILLTVNLKLVTSVFRVDFRLYERCDSRQFIFYQKNRQKLIF